MTNHEKIQLEIEKQIDAGFTYQEIRQNLLLQNFTNSEINEGLKKIPASRTRDGDKPQQFGILSVLVSVFFIIRGIMYLGKSSGTLKMFGALLLVVGIAGVIIKGVSMARK